MPFQYEQVYWLSSPWLKDDQALTGAIQRPGGSWMFWTGGEDHPHRTFDFMRLQQMEDDGSIHGWLEGTPEPFVFRPATVEQIRADPEAFWLPPDSAGRIQTGEDIYLLVHAAEVPDWYEAKRNPVKESTDGNDRPDLVEARGVPAPVGALHYWASRDEWFQKQPDGSWKSMVRNSTWMESHPSLPSNTLQAHTTPDGVLTPERQALHKEILDGLFAGKRRTRRPLAVFTMGIPASGKSSLAPFVSKNTDALVKLDPDAHREKLPEYQAGLALRARNASDITHREVSEINDRALERAMSDDPDQPGAFYSFMLDGVGTSPDFYEQVMREAKRKSYKVKLVLAHVRNREDVAAEDLLKIRAEDRGLRTGRFVPPERIERARAELPRNFERLAKLSDSAIVMDTSDPEKKSRLYRWTTDDTKGNPRWFEESMDRDDDISDDDLEELFFQAFKADHDRYAKMEPKFSPSEGVRDSLTDPDAGVGVTRTKPSDDDMPL